MDATQEVRVLGFAPPIKMNEDATPLITVLLGQGQEPVTEKALDRMHTEGGWAMLENIELVAGWLPKLEKKPGALETVPGLAMSRCSSSRDRTRTPRSTS